MKLDFAGRVVVVTGATGALARAVVESVLESGGVCHPPDRNATACFLCCREAVRQLRDNPPSDVGRGRIADFAAWPKAYEVAEAIVFLTSPQNRSLRGTVAAAFGRT